MESPKSLPGASVAANDATAPGRRSPSRFVPAGDLFVSDQPRVLSAILGSCVSVCLWDRRRRVGGMNHFQQPGGDHPRFLSGPKAIHQLAQRIYAQGGHRHHMHALLFGGAHVVEAFLGVSDIGAANIAVAESVLDELGIPIIHRHVGGTRTRKLFFRTDTGGHAVKLLPRRRPSPRSPAGSSGQSDKA